MRALKKETLEKYVESARGILIEVAKGIRECKRENKFIEYQELMDEMGGPGRGHIAEVLEEVSCREHEKDRPLITALVVHAADGKPGYGFWYIRCLPDSIKNASNAEKKAFWEKECIKVRGYWLEKK
jgi:hypothetical protein